MLRSSIRTKALAICTGVAVAAAVPAMAGKNSVVGTSVATVSLTATSTVPATNSSASTPGGGGGNVQDGFSGPAAYVSPASSPAPPSTVAAIKAEPGAVPTTLNGEPATAIPFTKDGGSYTLVVTDSGEIAVYPAN